MNPTEVLQHVKFAAVFAFVACGFLFPKATQLACRLARIA